MKMAKGVIIGVAAAAAVAAGAGAFAFMAMNREDPKEVVIHAFENIYTKDQKKPLEELFGISDFAENIRNGSTESGLELKLDSASDETLGQYAGSGLKFSAKQEDGGKKASLSVGAIYSGMNLVSLESYFDDTTIMVSLPELTGTVFTLDLGDGLEERLKDSPVVGKMLEEQGIDPEEVAAYMEEAIKQANAGETAEGNIDLEGLWKRYKEGSKAQDNFKAALTVTKGEKAEFTVDGAQVSCRGYNVTMSKDSMITFLKESSDFFLQDETLKGEFLRQLELSNRMSRIMGADVPDDLPSANELQKESYEEAKKSVDEMIDVLDKSLHDVQMTVHVDKKGRLASVKGSSAITVDDEDLQAEFDCQLKGGTYLTENLEGKVVLTGKDSVTISVLKQGSYDGKQLTGDLSVDLSSAKDGDGSLSLLLTNTYNSDGGDYQSAVEVVNSGSKLFSLSSTGTVDQLEKGKSIHVNMDSLEASFMDDSEKVVLSGECYRKPLEGNVTEPDGKKLDVLAATEDDWNSVYMEIVLAGIGLLGKLGQ